MSVIKVSALEGLVEIAREIINQSPVLDNLEDIQTFGYGNHKIYFDLKDYFQKLSPENHEKVQIVLDQCVAYKAFTNYYSAGTEMMQSVYTFGGLSIYIPQEVYPAANEEYKKLKWAIQT